MFVIQKHAASRLHYDFRLELEGTLKSWAVPKGPSLDPADKRLAMHVEDHPVEYATFEGIIPKGEYGGGTVLLWDRGTWRPEGDPHKEYRAGNLKFSLEGDKLRGSWALVRIKGGRDARDDGRSWLLIKHGDAEARPAKAFSVVDARPESVATGRTLDEIAAASDRVWHSNRFDGASEAPTATKARAVAGGRASATRSAAAPARDGKAVAAMAAGLPGARPAPLPKFVAPQLATLVGAAPTGEQWLHELKFDGYRILARLDEGRVQLLSRNERDWTDHFPAVASAAARLPARRALLDGEVAMLLPDGTTSFQALQNAVSGGAARPARLHGVRPPAPGRARPDRRGPGGSQARAARAGWRPAAPRPIRSATATMSSARGRSSSSRRAGMAWRGSSPSAATRPIAARGARSGRR